MGCCIHPSDEESQELIQHFFRREVSFVLGVQVPFGLDVLDEVHVFVCLCRFNLGLHQFSPESPHLIDLPVDVSVVLCETQFHDPSTKQENEELLIEVTHLAHKSPNGRGNRLAVELDVVEISAEEALNDRLPSDLRAELQSIEFGNTIFILQLVDHPCRCSIDLGEDNLEEVEVHQGCCDNPPFLPLVPLGKSHSISKHSCFVFVGQLVFHVIVLFPTEIILD